MVNESNFLVRMSGKRESSYYIDYAGVYKLSEIANLIEVSPSVAKDCYMANNAVYDETLDVYYFSSSDAAKKTVQSIMKNVKSDHRGKMVFLTESEIEYIRKALINEGVNTIHISNKIKDAIFNKLNAQ